MEESQTPSPEEPRVLGFYAQAVIGLIIGLGISGFAVMAPFWWPDAGFLLWIVVFVLAWIGIFQLARRQLHGIILGLLIGTAIGYFIIGRALHFPGLG